MKKSNLLNIKNKYTSLPKALKASAWFLFCSVMQKGISVITTPIFTRLLTTAEYGRYSVFSSWMDIISVFVTLRLYFGVYSQGLVKFEEEKDVFSSSLQGLTLFMSVLWFALYTVSHTFWDHIFGLSFWEMTAMFLMIWATAVFSFWAAEQRVDLLYKRLVLATIVVSMAKPLVGIILVQNFENKVMARVWGLAIVEVAGYTWMFAEQVKKGKTLYDKKIWLYALRFNIPLIPHYLAQVVLSSSDRIMIKMMVGEDKAGIYSVAYSISMLMTLLNTALQQTINPWIYRKIKLRKFEDIHKTVYISMTLVMAANLFLIMIAPEAVKVFAPKEYYEAVWIIPPVAMSAFYIFLYNVFSSVEFYYEKSKFIAISTVAAACLNVVLNFSFIELCGYQAAGYTTLACYIIYALMHYYFMNRILITDNGFPIYSTKLLFWISGLFMTFGFLLMALYNYTAIRYIIIFILVAMIFFSRNKIKPMIVSLLGKRKEDI